MILHYASWVFHLLKSFHYKTHPKSIFCLIDPQSLVKFTQTLINIFVLIALFTIQYRQIGPL